MKNWLIRSPKGTPLFYTSFEAADSYIDLGFIAECV